jgi:putative hydrolase of the HAD superfamily
MTFKIISFDADGTLVDHDFSMRMWGEEIPRIYSESHGVTLDKGREEVFKAFSDLGEDDPSWFSFEYWFKRLNLGDHREFVESHRGKVDFYPEVIDVLEDLSDNGHRMVVNSNAPKDILEIELEPIAHYFDHIFSAPTDFNRVKVDSEYYRDICFFLGVDPEEMVHVGDRWIDDVISPERVGVNAVYLDRKTGQRMDSIGDLKEFVSLLEAEKASCP